MKDMQFVAVNVFCDSFVGTCTLSASVHWEKFVEMIVLQVYNKLSIWTMWGIQIGDHTWRKWRPVASRLVWPRPEPQIWPASPHSSQGTSPSSLADCRTASPAPALSSHPPKQTQILLNKLELLCCEHQAVSKQPPPKLLRPYIIQEQLKTHLSCKHFTTPLTNALTHTYTKKKETYLSSLHFFCQTDLN